MVATRRSTLVYTTVGSWGSGGGEASLWDVASYINSATNHGLPGFSQYAGDALSNTYGNAGSFSYSNNAGGGGGGAGSAGASATGSGSGNGGAGIYSTITGSSVAYGGGGGGGDGYNGSNSSVLGGTGGSGIVVLRYLGSDFGNGGTTEAAGMGSAAGYFIHSFKTVGSSSLSLNAISVSLNGVISGSGNIILNANGETITLANTNTYTGATTISAGAVKVGNATALGKVAAGTTVANGAVLDLNGKTISNAEALTINGTGISSGGAVINSGATAASYTGLITLGGDSSIVGGSERLH